MNDDGVAQDLVQEVFPRTWRSAGKFDPTVATLRSWLFGIVGHVVIDEIRRKSVRPIATAARTYLRGRPYPEIAQEQRISVGTLGSRLFYGLKVT